MFRRFTSKFLIVLGLLALLLALDANGVAAERRSKDACAAISEQVAAGAAASVVEQQAFKNCFLVAKVTTDVSVVELNRDANSAVGMAAILPPPGSSCNRLVTVVTGRNTYGQQLWRYIQQIDWCYNGSRITDLFRRRWGEVSMSFWEYHGHIGNFESGGVGSWSYRAWTQGKFSLCFPVVGCFQHRYPWIDQTVRANGTASWSKCCE